MVQRLLVLVLLAVSLAACSAEAGPLPTLGNLESATISIDGHELVVAVADTPETRGRGLMFVTDLGEVDGMLFVFEGDTSTGFFMKNTLIPLDIAFFAADGRLVDVLMMKPCTTDQCPTYRPAGPYRHAIETPAGGFEFVDEASTLAIDS